MSVNISWPSTCISGNHFRGEMVNILNSLHQNCDLEAHGDWRHTLRAVFIGVLLNWNHMSGHFKTPWLFSSKGRETEITFDCYTLPCWKPPRAHMSPIWLELQICHTVNKVFVSWNRFDGANPSVNFYLVWVVIIASQFFLPSQGICFHSIAPRLLGFFWTVSLVILWVIPGSKEEAPGRHQ